MQKSMGIKFLGEIKYNRQNQQISIHFFGKNFMKKVLTVYDCCDNIKMVNELPIIM